MAMPAPPSGFELIQRQDSGNIPPPPPGFDLIPPTPQQQNGPNQSDQGWTDYLTNLAQSTAHGTTLGWGENIAAGLGAGGNWLARKAGMDIPERTYGDILKEQQGKLDVFRQTNPVAAYGSEFGGTLALPLGALGNLAKGGLTAGNVAKGALTVGAPIGATAELGEARNLTGPEDYLTTLGAGALKGAGGYAVAAPLAYGIGKGVQAVGQAVHDVFNPQTAAVRKFAGELADTGITPTELRKEVAPNISPAFAKRGLGETEVSDMINRSLAGESAKDIALSYGIGEKAVRGYVNKYNEKTAIPTNFLDLTSQVARQQGRAGAEEPVMNFARAAAGQSGQGPAIAAERLVQRQLDQPDRMLEHLAPLAGGKNAEAELARLDDVLGKQSQAAYNAAKANAQPFDLRPTISIWRKNAFESAGKIRSQLENAIDLFFEPQMIAGQSGNAAVRKLGAPISDLGRYQGARQALDQMVSDSLGPTGKATPLTRALTRFRGDINGVVRTANPLQAQADDAFHGASSVQELMTRGSKLDASQSAKTVQELRRFRTMTPEQQDAFRLGFRQKLETMAQRKGEGADAVSQFMTGGVKKTIYSVFPKKEADAVMSKFAREKASVNTLRKVFSGSRTTPLANQTLQMLNDAKMVADLGTGHIAGVIGHLRDKLAYGIGNRQAKEVLDLATQTDPQRLLPILDELVSSHAKLTQKSVYQTAIAKGIGVATAQNLAKYFQPE